LDLRGIGGFCFRCVSAGLSLGLLINVSFSLFFLHLLQLPQIPQVIAHRFLTNSGAWDFWDKIVCRQMSACSLKSMLKTFFPQNTNSFKPISVKLKRRTTTTKICNLLPIFHFKAFLYPKSNQLTGRRRRENFSIFFF